MKTQHFSYEEFILHHNVSRETFLRLKNFTELLIKWQSTINLISNSTLPTIWERHIIGSVQLVSYLVDEKGGVVDIGSGAGFPGMVLAIMGIRPVTLVESDARKVAFLKEAARVSDTEITIVHQRAEHVSYRDFSTITARGFAPLVVALNTIEKTLTSNNKILFLKGKNYREELEEARKLWSFEASVFPSATDREGVILSLTHPVKKELEAHG